MADTKVSAFGAIPVVDPAADLIPIIDASATGITKNKTVTPTALATALGVIVGDVGATDNAIVISNGIGGKTVEADGSRASLDLSTGKMLLVPQSIFNASSNVYGIGAAVGDAGRGLHSQSGSSVGLGASGLAMLTLDGSALIAYIPADVILAFSTGNAAAGMTMAAAATIKLISTGVIAITNAAGSQGLRIDASTTDLPIDPVGGGNIIINGAVPATDGVYNLPTSITIKNGIITAIS